MKSPITILILTLTMFNFAYAAETISEYKTQKGILKLISERENPSDFKDYTIFLNDKVIIQKDSQIKKIIGAFPENDPKIFIVQVITGGSGCPADHLIIDLNLPNDIVVGMSTNCSDIAKVKYNSSKNIVYLNIGGENWVYEKGKLK